MWSFQAGGIKLVRCLPKDQHTQRKLLNFEIGLKGRRQKLSIILENKVKKKIMLPKNVNNKKCTLKLIFFDEKMLKKIWMMFDTEN